MHLQTLENVCIPTQTITTYPPQPNVCPGCGKCNTCGRPYETQTPQPNAPYTSPQWVYTQVGVAGTIPNGTGISGLSGGGISGIVGNSGIANLNSVDEVDA